MNRRTIALQVLTTTLTVTLTCLAIYCLSAFKNALGILFGFILLYCAFLASAAIRSRLEGNMEMNTRSLRKLV